MPMPVICQLCNTLAQADDILCRKHREESDEESNKYNAIQELIEGDIQRGDEAEMKDEEEE